MTTLKRAGNESPLVFWQDVDMADRIRIARGTPNRFVLELRSYGRWYCEAHTERWNDLCLLLDLNFVSHQHLHPASFPGHRHPPAGLHRQCRHRAPSRSKYRTLLTLCLVIVVLISLISEYYFINVKKLKFTTHFEDDLPIH